LPPRRRFRRPAGEKGAIRNPDLERKIGRQQIDLDFFAKPRVGIYAVIE
jgi:hypothetical protein